jgi:hypothetical protein
MSARAVFLRLSYERRVVPCSLRSADGLDLTKVSGRESAKQDVADATSSSRCGVSWD